MSSNNDPSEQLFFNDWMRQALLSQPRELEVVALTAGDYAELVQAFPKEGEFQPLTDAQRELLRRLRREHKIFLQKYNVEGQAPSSDAEGQELILAVEDFKPPAVR